MDGLTAGIASEIDQQAGSEAVEDGALDDLDRRSDGPSQQLGDRAGERRGVLPGGPEVEGELPAEDVGRLLVLEGEQRPGLVHELLHATPTPHGCRLYEPCRDLGETEGPQGIEQQGEKDHHRVRAHQECPRDRRLRVDSGDDRDAGAGRRLGRDQHSGHGGAGLGPGWRLGVVALADEQQIDAGELGRRQRLHESGAVELAQGGDLGVALAAQQAHLAPQVAALPQLLAELRAGQPVGIENGEDGHLSAFSTGRVCGDRGVCGNQRPRSQIVGAENV